MRGGALRGAGRPWGRVAPLVLATMASQALLVVLAPAIVAIGDDLGASVGAVGQARSVTAAVAIAASVPIGVRIEAAGTAATIRAGAVLAIAASAALAAAPSLALFLAAHVLAGIALAALLSAGFAGVAGLAVEQRSWAIGWVAASNALAWIVVNPLAGVLTDAVSWRAAMAVPGALGLAALLVAGRAPVAPAGPPRLGLAAVARARSARRWMGSELVAYAAWTAFLTFSGAFLIEEFELREATVGWLLALGPAAYVAASTRTAALAERFASTHVIAGCAAVMAVLLLGLLDASGSAPVAAVLFVLVGGAAGLRTPASGGLGLAQLPDHPGTMMAARTATTQLGYLVGALVGGAVIEAGGYDALGLVLAAGMALAALLVLAVDDPRRPEPVPATQPPE